MPVALDKSKKDIALALYLQELKWSAISKQSGVALGTLRKWAERDNWRMLRDTTKQGLEQSGKAAMTLTVATKAADALREQFGSILAKHVTQLGVIPAKANLKHLRQVANVAEPLARTAKIVCGWDDSATAKAVDLSVMVAVRVDQAPQPVASCGAESEPVIDVTPQPDASGSTPETAH